MGHISDETLIRHLDDELSSSELLTVEHHLGNCEECRSRAASHRRAATVVDDLFLSFQPQFEESERGGLAQALARQQLETERRHDANRKVAGQPAGKLLPRTFLIRKRLEWAVALAACLAAGVFYSQHGGVRPSDRVESTAGANSAAALSSFDVDGEKFWALPYSNPDLPVTARVVQMEVPVASLADAGIVVEPVMTRTANPDRAVLADVLMGLDGQPVGVHVVSLD